MKELVQEIFSSIVTKPEEVAVSEKNDNGFKVFEVKVDNTDISRVIGKEGRIIRSIRNIIRIAALRKNEKVFIRLLEAP